MAVATSAGAEVQRPLATVVIGGLINFDFANTADIADASQLV